MDEWYYAANNQRFGPISGEIVERLAAQGVIQANTLLWRTGMMAWQTYAALCGNPTPQQQVPEPASSPPKQETPSQSEVSELPLPAALLAAQPGIGLTEEEEERAKRGEDSAASMEPSTEGSQPLMPKLASYELDDQRISEDTKDRYAQEVAEGLDQAHQDWQFAGFWLRLAAGIIDAILFTILSWVSFYLIAIMAAMLVAGMGVWILPLVVFGGMCLLVYGYWVWSVTAKQGTLGQRLIGLKLYRGDGSRVGSGTALMWFLCHYLSNMTFGLGHLMMLFDRENRTLHDMACNTRVVLD